MNARAALLLAAAALATGCAVTESRRVADDEDTGELQCYAEATGPLGRIAFDAHLDLSAGTIFHGARWEPARRTRPASIRSVEFVWRTPPEPNDGAHVTIGVTSERWFEGEARLVLRGGSGPPIELEAFYRRYAPIVSRGARLYEDTVPLAALRATMGEAGRAQLALVGEDGTDLVVGWIDAATLEQAQNALAALQPAIAAVLADPARNCEPPRPIIIRGG